MYCTTCRSCRQEVDWQYTGSGSWQITNEDGDVTDSNVGLNAGILFLTSAGDDLNLGSSFGSASDGSTFTAMLFCPCQ